MAKFNSKTIETLSVNAVRNSITVCPLLDEFVADNDKEPSWDGSGTVQLLPCPESAVYSRMF